MNTTNTNTTETPPPPPPPTTTIPPQIQRQRQRQRRPIQQQQQQSYNNTIGNYNDTRSTHHHHHHHRRRQRPKPSILKPSTTSTSSSMRSLMERDHRNNRFHRIARTNTTVGGETKERVEEEEDKRYGPRSSTAFDYLRPFGANDNKKKKNEEDEKMETETEGNGSGTEVTNPTTITTTTSQTTTTTAGIEFSGHRSAFHKVISGGSSFLPVTKNASYSSIGNNSNSTTGGGGVDGRKYSTTKTLDGSTHFIDGRMYRDVVPPVYDNAYSAAAVSTTTTRGMFADGDGEEEEEVSGECSLYDLFCGTNNEYDHYQQQQYQHKHYQPQHRHQSTKSITGARRAAAGTTPKRKKWYIKRHRLNIYICGTVTTLIYFVFHMLLSDLALFPDLQIDPDRSNAIFYTNTSSSSSSSSSSSRLDARLHSFKQTSSSLLQRLPSSKKTRLAQRLQYLQNLTDLSLPYDPEVETPYYWDVPLAGGSVALRVFSRCHGLILAECEMGRRQPHYDADSLAVFVLEDDAIGSGAFGTSNVTTTTTTTTTTKKRQQSPPRGKQQPSSPYLHQPRYVNVDLSTPSGRSHAADFSLLSSRLADVIATPTLYETTRSLFTKDRPGRVFGMFRHPVDRAVGIYHHVGWATWDYESYREEVRVMTLIEYWGGGDRSGDYEDGGEVGDGGNGKGQWRRQRREQQQRRVRGVDNPITRLLVQKDGSGAMSVEYSDDHEIRNHGKEEGRRRGGELEELTIEDLRLAKKIVQTKCLVGLYRERKGSLARFNRYFGWDDRLRRRDASDATDSDGMDTVDIDSTAIGDTPVVDAKVDEERRRNVRSCRDAVIRRGDGTMTHGLAVKEGSEEWNVIVERNQLDMELYRFVEKVYDVQGEKIFGVVS